MNAPDHDNAGLPFLISQKHRRLTQQVLDGAPIVVASSSSDTPLVRKLAKAASSPIPSAPVLRLALAILAVSWGYLAAIAQADPLRPNIIVFLVDDYDKPETSDHLASDPGEMKNLAGNP